MKKYFLLLLTAFFSFQFYGQVGIGTETPTEILDIDGTLRIRDLPLHGTPNAIHTTGENTASDTPTETFSATQMVVLDANGVLGTKPGLPSTSNTISWTSSGANFPTATGPDQPNAMQYSLGPLSVSFFTRGTNSFEFHIQSSNTDSYIVDIRSMNTNSAPYLRANGTLVQNDWTRIGGTVAYTLATSWHVNIWLQSVNRIYKLTVMSINGNPDTLTLNLQEL